MPEGFILAGGRSSRMGRDKSLIEIGGETLLARAARGLSGSCGKVTVVYGQTQETIEGLAFVRDEFADRGALGGLHAALAACRSRIAIILAVDLPLVTSDAVARLAGIADSSSKYLAVVPRQADGRPQPLFAAYRSRFCAGPIGELIRSDPRASVRDFLDRINPRYVEQSKLSDDPDLLMNLNTPADLARLAGTV